MSSIRCIRLFVVLFMFLAITCTKEPPYFLEDEPGKIVGVVKPKGVIAKIDLLQGILIQTTFTDSSGYFELDSVVAGVYNIEFSAKNYGRQTLSEVIVAPAQVTTLPDVNLKPVPEQIATFSPVNGADNFPLTASIQIEFATLMDHNSVENSFLLIPGVEGYFVWEIISGNSKLSFYPDDQYISNFSYTIMLTTDARTSYGDTLSFDFKSDFKTEGVKVSATIPENEATYVSPQSAIYIYFNSRMDRASVEQNFSITPVTIGNFRWFDSRRLCFQPGTFFASNTLYNVKVTENARDIYYSYLEDDKIFSFETEPLRITTNYPINGATFVSRSTPIIITFNTHVNQESVEKAFTLMPQVEGWNFQWSDVTRFQYSGTTKLQSNTYYAVTIDTTSSDAWGNLLPNNYGFIFRTGD